MKPTPTATKPSILWVQRHNHLYHYVVHQNAAVTFCNIRLTIGCTSNTTNSRPKKRICCDTCYAEVMRILQAWTVHKQQLLKQGICSTTSTVDYNLPPAPALHLKPVNHPKGSTVEELFISIIEALAVLGKNCNALLEHKRLYSTTTLRGKITVLPSTLQDWKLTCALIFEEHPEATDFWQPILQRFSGSNEACDHADLVRHIAAVSDVYNKYMAETFFEPEASQSNTCSQQTAKKRAKRQIFRQPSKTCKKKIIVSQGDLEAARRKQRELLDANSHWNTYERQGTRSSSPDPATNSTSGVPGNPTHRRW